MRSVLLSCAILGLGVVLGIAGTTLSFSGRIDDNAKLLDARSEGAVDAPSPTALSIRPCELVHLDRPSACYRVFAGGKRLQFGAPSGVGEGMNETPDAVFLLGSDASHMLGLDEVRIRSWQLGRRETLTIVGDQDVRTVVDGLNQAFELIDAAAYVNARGDLHIDGALLSSLPVNRRGSRQKVFDTGDVVVEAMLLGGAGPHHYLSYGIDYAGRRLEIWSCVSPPLATTEQRNTEAVLFVSGTQVGHGTNCETTQSMITEAKERGAGIFISDAEETGREYRAGDQKVTKVTGIARINLDRGRNTVLWGEAANLRQTVQP